MFECKFYLESREVPGKHPGKYRGGKRGKYGRVKSAGNYLPFISGSGDVIFGDATSGHVISGEDAILTNPPQILIELSPYTTDLRQLMMCSVTTKKCIQDWYTTLLSTSKTTFFQQTYDDAIFRQSRQSLFSFNGGVTIVLPPTTMYIYCIYLTA